MTKLDGVNEMLEWLGIPEKLTLPGTNDGTPEGEAEAKLDRTTLRILAMGWWDNTRSRTLVPVAGEIDMTGVLGFRKNNDSPETNLAIQDNKLFNLDTETDDAFTTNVSLDCIIAIDFEMLSVELQAYIVAEASKALLQSKRPGSKNFGSIRESAIIAKGNAVTADTKRSKQSILSSTHINDVTGNRPAPPSGYSTYGAS